MSFKLIALVALLPLTCWATPLKKWLAQNGSKAPYLVKLDKCLGALNAEIFEAEAPFPKGIQTIEVKTSEGLLVLRANYRTDPKDASLESLFNLSSKDHQQAAKILAETVKTATPPGFEKKGQLPTLIKQVLDSGGVVSLSPETLDIEKTNENFQRKNFTAVTTDQKINIQLQFSGLKTASKPLVQLKESFEDLKALGYSEAQKVQVPTYDIRVSADRPNILILQANVPSFNTESGIYTSSNISHGSHIDLLPNTTVPTLKISFYAKDSLWEQPNARSKIKIELAKRLLKALRPDTDTYEVYFVDEATGTGEHDSKIREKLPKDDCNTMLSEVEQIFKAPTR